MPRPLWFFSALLLALLAALFAWRLASGRSDSAASAPTLSTSGELRPPVATTDPVGVFQRAFWKRPTSADQILNALREEWLEDGRVTRWRWFIVLKPSPDLVRYLRDENAFSLTPANEVPVFSDAPPWFRCHEMAADVYSSRGGHMNLVFIRGENLLFATDSGSGMRAGAPEPATATPAPVQSGGRLPASPPPRPES